MAIAGPEAKIPRRLRMVLNNAMRNLDRLLDQKDLTVRHMRDQIEEWKNDADELDRPE